MSGQNVFPFLVACTRLYKSPCQSVGRLVRLSVGRSCHALLFLQFLGFSMVGSHIFKCLVNYKQHLRPYKSPCWLVGPSVRLTVCDALLFFAFLGYLQVGKHIFVCLVSIINICATVCLSVTLCFFAFLICVKVGKCESRQV